MQIIGHYKIEHVPDGVSPYSGTPVPAHWRARTFHIRDNTWHGQSFRDEAAAVAYATDRIGGPVAHQFTAEPGKKVTV